MADCSPVRSLLRAVVEYEAEPREAVRVADHVAECTGCRILLARERRLAELLGRIDDRLPVDADFTGHVMSALPDGPPPAPKVSLLDRRRGLKLAAWLAFVGLVGAGAQLASGIGGGALRGLPRFAAHDPGSLIERLIGWTRIAALGVVKVGSAFQASLTASPQWTAALLVLMVALLTAPTMAALSGLRLAGQLVPRRVSRSSSSSASTPRRRAASARSPWAAFIERLT